MSLAAIRFGQTISALEDLLRPISVRQRELERGSLGRDGKEEKLTHWNMPTALGITRHHSASLGHSALLREPEIAPRIVPESFCHVPPASAPCASGPGAFAAPAPAAPARTWCGACAAAVAGRERESPCHAQDLRTRDTSRFEPWDKVTSRVNCNKERSAQAGASSLRTGRGPGAAAATRHRSPRLWSRQSQFGEDLRAKKIKHQ